MDIEFIKAKVLDLAIKGKLVEQRADEKLSPDVQALPELQGEFELPANWKWVKAKHLINLISGTSYKKEDITNKNDLSAIRIMRGGNVTNGVVIVKDDDVFVKAYLANKDSTITDHDIVIVASTGSKIAIGRSGVLANNMALGGHTIQIGAFLRIIRPQNKEFYKFLKFFYSTSFYKNQISHLVSGTNINNIKKSHITDMLVPVPPLEEQKRICAKLEELFGILNEISNLKGSLRAKLDLIRKTAIDRAIKGKLVEQCADEKLSPDVQALPELQGEFEIPANWKWAAIEDISQINPKNKLTDDYDVSFVAMADISPGFDNSFQQSTAKWGKVKKGYTHFQDGDVLVAKITPCFENRKSAVARGLINRCGAGTTEVYALRPKYAHIIADYLLFFCKSERFIQQGISRFTGSVGQQRLSKDNLKRFKIPLPPLEEQLRIVTKLEEILTNISTIEKLLNNN